ncbi:mitochondrial carrier domain-containing protein [Tricladium varicosporioides]|nr:mitochondrial carrier domain-containing protein [Hymenoscyphus varicosporioides]
MNTALSFLSGVAASTALAPQTEMTRGTSPESFQSTITVDAVASSNIQSSSSTPPTSIGDSVSVASNSPNVGKQSAPSLAEQQSKMQAEPPQSEFPIAEQTGRSRRARPSIATYNVKVLTGTAIHAPKKYDKDPETAAAAVQRRKTINLQKEARSSVPAESPKDLEEEHSDPVEAEVDQMLNDGIEVLDLQWSVLGKRTRQKIDDKLFGASSKVPRELRNLADTKEFLHIDEQPVFHEVWSNGKLVTANEPPKKKRKTEEVAIVKSKIQEESKPVEKKLVNGRREKVWLSKGLYAGQPGEPEIPDDKGIGEDMKGSHANVVMPLPMFRDRFVGDAAAQWKKADIFDSFSSKCVCTPESGCDERCQNRIMLYECDDENCNTGKSCCTNRAFATLMERRKGGGKYRIGVEVVKTPDRGYGVRSNRCFEANQIIVEYTGEIITEDECDRRMNEDYKNNECYYLMSFDQNMILDGTKGSIARFVNHSCKPNCRMVKWIVGGKPRMALFAGDSPIMSGDELTYDYNFDPFSAKNVQECRCGSDNCRGVLGPKPKDPKPVKETIKDAVRAGFAGVKAGKRKLMELFAGDDDDEPRSPKKRKIKEMKGIKRSASSASMQVVKDAAKAVKKSASMNFLSSRPTTGGSRSSSNSIRVTPKSKGLRTYGKQSTPRKSNMAIMASASASTTPEKMTSVGRRTVKKSVVRIGGMTAATLTAPLDVLKTRLQSDFYQNQLAQSRLAKGISPHAHLNAFRSGLLHFRETFQILGSVHRVEGWRALFKGLGPNLIGVVPARSINFFVVGNGKRIISNNFNNGEESAWVVLCAAALAGIVTSTATNPIWLIKTRLQLDKNVVERTGGIAHRKYKNSWDCIKQVVRQEGIRGLYKGMSASYLGVTESTLQWVLYEQMKKSLAKREEKIITSGRERTAWDNVVSWTGSIGAAGSAKLVAALATYPHEVARTRLRQAPLENGQPKYTGLVQCFKLVWKEEGMVAMYGGLTPHLLRTVPSAAIMFGMYEGILKLLHAE